MNISTRLLIVGCLRKIFQQFKGRLCICKFSHLASELTLILLINSRLALEDPLWKLMQAHEDVPYRVYQMKDDIYHAWTRTAGSEPSCKSEQTGFLHADRLLKLYDILKNKPLISQPALIELGHRVSIRDQAFRKAYEESLRKRKGRRNTKHNEEFNSSSQSQMADNFAKKASATDTLKEMQKELDATLARLAKDEDETEQNSTVEHNSMQPQVKRPMLSNLAAASPLATTRIGPSASSKLNYIINEVIRRLISLLITYLTFIPLGSKIFSQ
jgi:hypothetical protein